MFFVFCLGLSIGLIVAWNIWPQPAWLKNLYDKAIAHISTKKTTP